MTAKIGQPTSKTVIFLLALVVLSACDRVCKRQVNDFTNVQNLTGRSLQLTVCKGSFYGSGQLILPADQLPQQVSLGSRQDSVVRGGSDTCAGVKNGENLKMAIALAPESFHMAKLCQKRTLDGAQELAVIVESHQPCPPGTDEQPMATNCMGTNNGKLPQTETAEDLDSY